MSSQAQAILAAGVSSRTPPIIAARPRSPSLLQRVLVFPVKLFWGMAFCQGLVSSILVVGWTYRLTQRSVLKYWWLRSRRPQQSQTLADFLAESDRTRPCQHWPNWFSGPFLMVEFLDRLAGRVEHLGAELARRSVLVVRLV